MDRINLFNKELVVAVIFLFMGMSVIPSTGTMVEKKFSMPTNYDGDTLYVGGDRPIEFFDIEIPIDRKEVLSNNPPVVEILYPQNGSIVYTRYSNISVKCTDDTGLTDVDLEYGGKQYTVGYSTGINPPCKIFYLNRSMQQIRPGYVWIVAKAYDEDGNIGIDTAVFYYNDSNDPDLYPPEIDFLMPRKGYFYVFDKFIRTLNINLSIVIGKFEILAVVDDLENHLQKVELYIDNEIVYEQEHSNSSLDIIRWDCDKLLIGMHEIKIVAIDSYDNSAMQKLNCFIINFF